MQRQGSRFAAAKIHRCVMPQLRETEVSGACVLLAAPLAALIRANVDPHSYESLVTGTPSFFVNGRRHEGAYDIDTLTAKVRKILSAGPVKPD